MELSVLDGQLTMSSLEMVSYINSTRKEGEAELTHANFLKKVPNVLNGGEVNFYSSYFNSQNKEQPCYRFPKREAMLMAMSYSYELQAIVYDAWQDAEAKHKPALPVSYRDAVAALLMEIDAKEKAEEIARIALETKAEIGNRREATAMNTASQAVKKANQLEIELDKSKEYCTVKRMEMLCHGQKFNWRLLKSTGIELGVEAIDIFDANYGKVKAYHKDVWLEAYGLTF